MTKTHHSFHIDSLRVSSDAPLTVIAGPCVLESRDVNDTIAQTLRDVCASLGVQFVFKASFDKANRSSIRSDRGPGLDAGLAELARLKQLIDTPVTTDIHEPHQAAPVGEVADVLQIPAFLCRQTDLLQAAAETGRAVNAKKGQFMAPREMSNVITKLSESGCADIMLTERGTFFGYHRLVNDFIGLGDLMDLGVEVCFDVTHSTQLPGGDVHATAGRPDRAALLARAAVAAGVNAVFIEAHPDPASARSDGSTVQPLQSIEPLLADLVNIRQALHSTAALGKTGP